MKTVQSNRQEWPEAIAYFSNPDTIRSLSAIGLDIIDLDDQTYTVKLRTLDEYHVQLQQDIEGFDRQLVLRATNRPLDEQEYAGPLARTCDHPSDQGHSAGVRARLLHHAGVLGLHQDDVRRGQT